MQPDGNDPADKAARDIRAIYSDLEKRPVERDCVRRTECCQFKLTGRTPMLTAGEALVAAAALRATGRRELLESTDEKAGRCPMLNPFGKCIIYDARPFGCRTHFCAAAGGPYTRNEVRDLVRRLEEVDAALGGDGPHALPMAVESALEKILHPPRGAQRR
jgi:uncharacterized protein